MTTVIDVARDALASLNTDANVVLAVKWVANRYRQLASRTRLRSLREIGEVVIPAEITAGTVTATRGSKVVTGDATAAAAWLADSSQVEKSHFRGRVAWHEIESVSGTDLTLKSIYTEDDVTAGSYKIVQRFIALDSRARWLGTFLHVRHRRPVDRISLAELNMRSPSRQSVSVGPTVYTEIGTDANEARLIEMFPYPQKAELILYVFWSVPPELQRDSLIPIGIDAYVLREGALIDIMRYESAKAMQAGNVEAAAFWRNEYRAQSTSWERNILEAARTDKGSDDMTMIFERHGTRFDTDIRTARDQVYATWPR